MQARLRNFSDLFNPSRARIFEAVIPPSSYWIKKTVGELRLRKTHGISVLAVNRGDQVFREDVRQVALSAGDTLVLHSFWRDLAQTAESHDFVVVTDYPKEEHRPSKIWHAVAFFALAMGLGLFTDIRLSIAMLVGALIGFGLGLLEYRLMSAVVIGALRRTDRSTTEAEKADYERRIRILRAVLVVMTIGVMPILGFVIGRTLSG